MDIRKKLNADILIQLHVRENMSLSKIGEIYGVSRQRVHQLKKEYEKKHGKITRKVSIDVLTLKHYLDQGWTSKRIADHFEMSPSKISRLIRKYREEYELGASHVKISKKKTEDIISELELRNLYTIKLLTDKEIAEIYQVSPSSVNLLRNKYKIPTNKTKSLRKLKRTLTKEIFIELYLHKKNTLRQIADKYNCNVVSILKLKEEYKIKKGD